MLAAARATLAQEARRVSAARERADQAVASLGKAMEAHETAQRVASLLVAVADAARDAVRLRVEHVVTLLLRAVIGPHMSFRFDVDVKRGQVEMVPEVGYLRGGSTSWRRLNDVGGGVVDLVAFGLRLSILAMSPGVRPVLIADEPFRHVSADRMPALSRVVRALADRLGMQIIVISHEPELAASASTVIEVSRGPDGATVVCDSNGGLA
jgi:DNA repair exonuclease SbcCD ATPase subunit